ncbi:MAG TPA: SBBP repeat-containing protein [Patescibacteria group bacterium]|nr:SBBP repeat-containing protein [Patescibacteria group bacterium]
MKKTLFVLAVSCILFATASSDRPLVSSPQSFNRSGIQDRLPVLKSQPGGNPAGLHVDFGSLPLYFTANRGQVDGRALFYAKASRYTLWLTEAGLVFDSYKFERPEPPVAGKGPSLRAEKPESRKSERDVSRLIFLNGAKHPQIVAVDESPLKVNYFIGNDPAKWHAAVPTSKAVLYKNIYKNIDLKVYGSEGRIEYDWIVRPGGDPRDIKFEYRNVKGTRLDEEGNLLVETNFGELMHKKPAAFQERVGKPAAEKRSGKSTRAAVESAFKKIGANAYGFEVGAYQADLELIIDPVVLAYSSYLGGSGTDNAYGIAVDGSGNAYVTGETYSTDFPTLNHYQTAQTDLDAFVTKIDTTQSGSASLVYSTYLGGNNEDHGFGIAVDSSGNAYVTGNTLSTDFPILNQYQTDQTGWDVFVTKLDTTQSGSASLVYSTYLGGEDEDSGRGIAVDNSGNAYVTGYTTSTNFPTLNPYQTDQVGSDAFVTKIDTTQSGSASLVYSTYLGGNAYERGYGIAADGSGNAYVTGITVSTNFPTLNPYQASLEDEIDAFVTRIDTTQSGSASLVYSTYLGGNNEDRGFGIAVDSSGNAYVTGITFSTNFPTLNPYQTYPDDDDRNAFVTRIDTTQSGSASLVYSTYLGGEGEDYGMGIAVDNSGKAYVTGETYSTDFPTLNQYQTDQGSADAFVTKIDTTQSGSASLVYSTYLGGNNDERGFGIAVDSSGNAYVTGSMISTDFPTLNQYQTDQGVPDAFIAKIAGVVADIAVTKTATNLTPRVGEAFNFTVKVTNNGSAAASGLKVTDSLPAGLTYVSSTASTGTYISGTGIWDIGALANGATATLTIGVSGSASGMVTNRASVSALNENDPNAANDSDSVNVMVKNIYSLTIATGAGGTTNPVPGTYTYVEGTSVSVQATASAGYRFSSWSGDASGTTNPITITMTGNKTVTANFIRQYTLTIAAGAGGTTSPVPGAYTYDEGTSVSVQATASAGYRFGNWSGDASGSANPVTLVMNGNKAIQANFTRVVKAPLNLTAEKLVNRNVSLIEYIARLRWQPNPENAGMISYRIYRIENGQAATIADVAAGTYEYIVRRLQATKAYLFGVTAVDSQGWESDMVEIAVQ